MNGSNANLSFNITPKHNLTEFDPFINETLMMLANPPGTCYILICANRHQLLSGCMSQHLHLTR